MHTALLAHHARIETNLPAALPVQTGDPHATLDRLFDSRHVKDLRLIIRAALAVVLLLSAGCVAALWRKDATWTSIGAFITPVLTVFGAVLAWAYQVGSARLGVVDLFACEISPLCRVAAVVGSVR